MSDPRITRTEPTTPARPATAVAARPVAEAAPQMPGDRAAFVGRPVAAPTGAGASDALDKNGWWAGFQTFFQGATRAGALAGRALLRAKAFTTIAEVLDGNAQVIGQGVERLTAGAANLATRVVPRHADDAMKVVAPAIKGGGSVLRVLGKAAPVFNVVAATWDTYKAASETDPARKAGAWANAGLSIGGTGMALGAVALGATPLGWALGIGAAAFAGFQLVDNLAFGGRGTQWLGEQAAAAGGAIADGARAIAGGAVNGVRKVWGAITSL